VYLEEECAEKLEYLRYKSYRLFIEFKLDTIDNNNITREVTYMLYTKESFFKN